MLSIEFIVLHKNSVRFNHNCFQLYLFHNFDSITVTGFKKTLGACCGGGGPYNYNASVLCGKNPTSCCNDPSSYINWDGGHCTEAAYRWVAEGILDGTYSDPPINALCPLTQSSRNLDS